MREILFRGKRTSNGEWVSGGSIVQFVEDGVRSFYMPQYNEKCTCTHDGLTDDILGFEDCRFYKVDGKTICQYTGLKDKNGKKIFEGDIVKTHYANTKKNDFVEQVVFHNGKFCSLFKMSGGGKMYAILADGIPHLPQDKLPYMEWCEVIGNIHDNPEVLKGDE